MCLETLQSETPRWKRLYKVKQPYDNGSDTQDIACLQLLSTILMLLSAKIISFQRKFMPIDDLAQLTKII